MDPTVITALEPLQDLKVKKRYRELFGEESKSSNKQFLFRRIAWRMQANADGDLSERARRRATEIADDRDLRIRAPKEFLARPDSGSWIVDRTRPPKDGRLPAPGTLHGRKQAGGLGESDHFRLRRRKGLRDFAIAWICGDHERRRSKSSMAS